MRPYLLVFMVVALLTCVGCTDEMSSMALYNEASGRFDNKIQLDWTIIGGSERRSDRLLIALDGYVRRNKGGNLQTRTLMTDGERAELAALRTEWGRIDRAWHSDPSVAHPSAWRLRFDGRGRPEGKANVSEFAERVLERVAPQVLVRDATNVVEAVVHQRDDHGRAVLVIGRVLGGCDSVDRSASDSTCTGHEILRVGAKLHITLPEAREGVGNVPAVFALWHPTRRDGALTVTRSAYIKGRFEDIAKLAAAK